MFFLDFFSISKTAKVAFQTKYGKQLEQKLLNYLRKNSFICHYGQNIYAFLTSNFLDGCTLLENHRKSLIQHCEQSELCLHFEWTKEIKNA